jgi:uncharacterized protein YndB with AHSA1/START domain
MTTTTAQTTQVYQVFIKATPEAIWDAITKPEFTERYFYKARPGPRGRGTEPRDLGDRTPGRRLLPAHGHA